MQKREDYIMIAVVVMDLRILFHVIIWKLLLLTWIRFSNTGYILISCLPDAVSTGFLISSRLHPTFWNFRTLAVITFSTVPFLSRLSCPGDSCIVSFCFQSDWLIVQLIRLCRGLQLSCREQNEPTEKVLGLVMMPSTNVIPEGLRNLQEFCFTITQNCSMEPSC